MAAIAPNPLNAPDTAVSGQSDCQHHWSLAWFDTLSKGSPSGLIRLRNHREQCLLPLLTMFANHYGGMDRCSSVPGVRSWEGYLIGRGA